MSSPSPSPSNPLLLLFLLLLSIPSSTPSPQSNGQGFISLSISDKGLFFIKDLLIEQAISTLTPLTLPTIQKSIKIPLLGKVYVSLSNITLSHVNVSSSTIQPGETGIAIVTSGMTADLNMTWKYSYRTWVIIPIDISDSGTAQILVEDMEVGLTLKMENQGGGLRLSLMECGCYLKDISITLDGGASWFYQGLVDAFEGKIRSAVAKAITKKLEEGIVKLDAFLQKIPKEVPVDDISALNATFVNDPLLSNSSVGFEINGLFMARDKVSLPKYYLRNSQTSAPCNGQMLQISLDKAVLDSASDVYFKAGIMRWIVDKVPDDSLLNTAGWKYMVPQLYKKYPNDKMQLNISLSSPPVIWIISDQIQATVSSDMTIEVLDGGEVIPVACISMVISASGTVEVSGNNLAGRAGLNEFTLNLKWSKVGRFHMYLIQTVVWVFLKDVAQPYVNSHLQKGFPLPIIHGFSLQNAEIQCSGSAITVCSDVTYADDSYNVKQLLNVPLLINA
ncbi:putative BPI/LBP family protein At1g04970 [Magnolia sinica]|uniref:putative BPI/LBP family protein At1g04970 n=1 Tax=Magnolia sinica TaxID=86752 RepID=UPI002658C91C|nr:putative BPI/LBP family protein At1g04970 [Magnolia sinica]